MALSPTDYNSEAMSKDFGTVCLITNPMADTYLRKARKLANSKVPEDSYSRWCGGKGGFDLFVERVHE